MKAYCTLVSFIRARNHTQKSIFIFHENIKGDLLFFLLSLFCNVSNVAAFEYNLESFKMERNLA